MFFFCLFDSFQHCYHPFLTPGSKHNHLKSPFWSFQSLSRLKFICSAVTLLLDMFIVLPVETELTMNVHMQVNKDLSRMKRFNAQEALEYGLIDRIVRPPRIKADAPHKDAGTGLG